MRRRRSLPLILLASALALLAPAAASAATTTPSLAASVPNGKPLYADGQDGRILMNGTWLLRMDPSDVGLGQHWFAGNSTTGWTTTSVPNAWNANDQSQASFNGSVAWYRKDFRLPSKAKSLDWIVRFESANFSATVWLNGKKLGTHVGGYLPFELDLKNVARNRVNHLVVRVDNRRPAADPTGAPGEQPIPPGGWWNYGGLLREVYLRRVDRVDISTVQVSPSLPRPRGPARVTTTAQVRNLSKVSQTVHLTERFGTARVDLGTRTIPAGATVTFTGKLVVKHPRLWAPGHPSLYKVRLAATAATGKQKPTPAAGYSLHTGIRSIKVTSNGALTINGGVVHFRGVALHEDTATQGAAMDNDTRAKLMALVQQSNSIFVRAHYPLHPEFQELADRLGILLWSEIPATYQLPEADLGRPRFKKLALAELEENIVANRNHPSVVTWSIGNEMASAVGRNQAAYIKAAAKLAKTLDPTRPVALAFAGHPETPCQPAYAPIDFLGMNDYFGWYTGFGGNIADRDGLSAYLDVLRKCYPHKALAVTEYGAEANRDGPVEEKGTYAFQNAFVQYHEDVYASKPWLTGSTYFALQEFRVRPGWGGGNPWGTPPLHTKGLIRLDFSVKPAFAVFQAANAKVQQYVPAGGAK